MRLKDVLCAQHAHETATRWPLTSAVTCARCWYSIEVYKKTAVSNDRYWVLPDLESDQFIEFKAYHEAGHAVIARSLGVEPSRIYVDPLDARTKIVRPSDRLGGYVCYTRPPGMTDRQELQIIWAGREASFRWLHDKGLDTLENRVDAVFFAGHDAERARTLELPQTNLEAVDREAKAAVDASWSSIDELAIDLVRQLA